MSRDKVIERDKFGNKILLMQYPDNRDAYDLMTDGRVFLDVRLAKALARKLLKFADRRATKGE